MIHSVSRDATLVTENGSWEILIDFPDCNLWNFGQFKIDLHGLNEDQGNVVFENTLVNFFTCCLLTFFLITMN